jgi:hypothetical protein
MALPLRPGAALVWSVRRKSARPAEAAAEALPHRAVLAALVAPRSLEAQVGWARGVPDRHSTRSREDLVATPVVASGP